MYSYRVCSADDALIFGEWFKDGAYNLVNILQWLGEASDLSINFGKRKLYGVGVLDNQIVEMTLVFRYSPDSFSFTYFGLPVGTRMDSVKAWNEGPECYIKFTAMCEKKIILESLWWMWWFKVTNTALWRRIIQSIYGEEGGLQLNHGQTLSVFFRLGLLTGGGPWCCNPFWAWRCSNLVALSRVVPRAYCGWFWL
ncbi:uncharacterized protein [Rutidosis leptorrhynchoides]|uniref:uncharacterized protein n=1 Tax=Rutidosis leptorrhynchoides TaxID=125765 RepID=UPI003A99F84E